MSSATAATVAVALSVLSASTVHAAKLANDKPALVFDADSGLVLFAQKPDLRWHPASLTKMMTAYVTFQALKSSRLQMDSQISCSKHANAQAPSKIGLPIGSTMSVSLALQALIVKSANDVAVMLSEGVGEGLLTPEKRTSCMASATSALSQDDPAVSCQSPGHAPDAVCRADGERFSGAHQLASNTLANGLPPLPVRTPHKPGSIRQNPYAVALSHCRRQAFMDEMNTVAKRLGMTRTHFVNPNGLPDQRQVTTARDMALLARALIKEYPQHAGLFSQRAVKVGRLRLRSHNGLLASYQGADGMKTGFICASGFNIVASATRDERQLVAVVLGSSSSGSRNQQARKLLDYGYEVYPWKSALAKETIDTMAYSPLADLGPVDIRKNVRSYACGFRAARKSKARRKSKRKKSKRRVAKARGARLSKRKPKRKQYRTRN